VNIFRIDPHYKHPSTFDVHVHVGWRCRNSSIFTIGVYGKILHLVSNQIEISPQSLSKMFQWSRHVWVWLGKKYKLYRRKLVCTSYIFHWEFFTVSPSSIENHLVNWLLRVSYPSATESGWNSPRSFQHFRRTLRQNFNWIWQRIKDFPIDPQCNNRLLSATL